MQLKNYQEIAHSLLNKFNGRAILGDDMGMGKSCTGITYAEKNNFFPCLIVCQSTIKDIFREEIKKWSKCNWNIITIKSGKVMPLPKKDNLFIIINYDLLDKWKNEIKKLHPKILIADEIHTVENKNTKKAKSLKYISEEIDKVILMSGTIFKNDESELFVPLNILFPQLFINEKILKGYIKSGRLRTFLYSRCLIRRTKEDYLNLPPKDRRVISVNIKNIVEYKKAETDFKAWLKQADLDNSKVKIHAFAKMEYLKQIAARGKLDEVKAFVRNHTRDRKLVAFFTHTEPLEEVYKEFKDKAVKISGSVTNVNKTKNRIIFQNDPNIKLLTANIKSGGTGLTLTAAYTVLIAELPYTSVDCDQCEDRVHRIGQNNKDVFCYYMIARNTIEERLALIIDRKRIKLKRIDGKIPSKKEMLLDLLHSYTKEN